MGRYCASTDEGEIAEGLAIVERQMRERTVRPGEEELFKSRAREQGSIKNRNSKFKNLFPLSLTPSSRKVWHSLTATSTVSTVSLPLGACALKSQISNRQSPMILPSMTLPSPRFSAFFASLRAIFIDSRRPRRDLSPSTPSAPRKPNPAFLKSFLAFLARLARHGF